MRHALVLALALCVLVENARAATEIAALGQSRIAFIADSKEVDGASASAGGYVVCRIGSAGKTYWMASGLRQWDDDGGFSLDAIAAESMSGPDGFQGRARLFVDIVSGFLKKEWPKIRSDPSRRLDGYPEGQAVIETVFADFEDGKPVLHVISFSPSSVEGRVLVNTSETDLSGPAGGYVLLGRHEAIDAELKRSPALKSQIASASVAQRLIEIEIAAAPDQVGPPIVALEVSKEGPRWLERGVC